MMWNCQELTREEARTKQSECRPPVSRTPQGSCLQTASAASFYKAQLPCSSLLSNTYTSWPAAKRTEQRVPEGREALGAGGTSMRTMAENSCSLLIELAARLRSTEGCICLHQQCRIAASVWFRTEARLIKSFQGIYWMELFQVFLLIGGDQVL